MKSNLRGRKEPIKQYIDPFFSKPLKSFPVCRIYLDGKWKGELWHNADSDEYGLKFRNFEGTAVDIVFPSSAARLEASSLIIPNNPLELPHSDYLIKRISDNSNKVNTNPLKKLVLGTGTILLTMWLLLRRSKK